MLKSNLLSIGAAAVLTFGLAACAPDKKQDTWSVDAPQIALKSGSSVGFTDKAQTEKVSDRWSPSLKEMSTRVLPPDAEVVFPSLEKADVATSPYAISVRSHCTAGSLSGVAEFSVANVSRISLLALIPKNILVTTLANEKFYTCDVDLMARNALGSSTNFALSVFINNLDDVSQISLESYEDRSELPAKKPTVLASDANLYVLPKTRATGAVTVTLGCDLYAQSKTYTDVAEFHLSDLVAPVSTESAVWQKTCRISVSPAGESHKLKISAPFVVSSGVPDVTLERAPVACDQFLRPKLTSFRVTNTSKQKQIIGLQMPQTLTMAFVEKFDWGPDKTPILLSDLNLDMTGADAYTADNGTIWLELAPTEAATVSMTLKTSNDHNACSPGLAQTYTLMGAPRLIQTGRFRSLAELVGKALVPQDKVTDLVSMFPGAAQPQSSDASKVLGMGLLSPLPAY